MKSWQSPTRRRRALAEVPLDLDGVFVDGDCLSGHEGALVLLHKGLRECGLGLSHGHGMSRGSLQRAASWLLAVIAALLYSQTPGFGSLPPRARHVQEHCSREH